MLARSNSNAADRLRRAKSTSSTHTSSSGHQRTSTSIDPFVTRQHAELAAVEAYTRAHQFEQATLQAQRPVPPKLQRRRSQGTGRAEGSHFEDARLGRRRSNSSKADGAAVNAHTSASRSTQARERGSGVGNGSGNHGDERIVTRKRSVVPPTAHTMQPQRDAVSLTSSTARPRKTQSSYTDGSPAPRNASTLKECSSTLQLSTPQTSHANGYTGNLAHLSDFGAPADATVGSFTSPRPSIRETQTDEEIIAMARDRCLLDFREKKVRQRKSMFLVPFQKLRAVTLHESSDSGYDRSLPPFNDADEPGMNSMHIAPKTLPPPLQFEAVLPQKKSRTISESVKGRLKNVFRKASRVPSGLPVQHVEAKHFHYAASEEAYHSLSERRDEPLVTAAWFTTVPSSENKANSGNSRLSAGQVSAAKSRVTSWTDSAVAGTWSTRPDSEQLNRADEHGGLKRSDSTRTLRKASSFFGRPIRNRLRRASRAELKSSEESEGLYSALKERINPSCQAESSETAEDVEIYPGSNATSALSTLPSQQKGDLPHPSTLARHAPTVRTVTPDSFARRTPVGMPSPILEVLSPIVTAPVKAATRGKDDDSEECTPKSQLRRRPAVRDAPPSQEQLLRRMERSKNRWQSPLDELSPAAPRSTRATMMDDNPCELRSLSQPHQHPAVVNDLPHHARVGGQSAEVKREVLSPSVYSRASDGASPRPDTPVESVGMMVQITGREVRTYDISPKRIEPVHRRPIQGSSEWRRWLSDEFTALEADNPDFTLPRTFRDEPKPASNPTTRPTSAAQSRPDSASPALDARPGSSATQRPRLSSRRSSYMNERYPMIDGSRNSSDRSIGSRHMASRAGERNSNSEHAPSHTTTLSGGSQAPKCSLTRQRVVTGEHSVGQLGLAARSRSALGTYDTKEELVADENPGGTAGLQTTSGKAALPSQTRVKATSRPKSAFDLRANYKSANTSAAKPLEVRRKAGNDINPSILEDTTIQDIAAGPYASQIASASGNKENTPPSEASSLPAVSSSEWLAAGPNKARKTSAVHPARRKRSVSRYSPERSGTAKEGKGSPAQRMATEYLEKRSGESTPAFL